MISVKEFRRLQAKKKRLQRELDTKFKKLHALQERVYRDEGAVIDLQEALSVLEEALVK